MKGLELFKHYEKMYEKFISTCTELDKLCDDTIKIEDLKKKRDKFYAEAMSTKENFITWARSGGIKFTRSKCHALEVYNSEFVLPERIEEFSKRRADRAWRRVVQKFGSTIVARAAYIAWC